MDALKKVLDALPFSGYKSFIGVVASALILGFMQMGMLDAAIGEKILLLTTLWTGAGVVHKDLKAAE